MESPYQYSNSTYAKQKELEGKIISLVGNQKRLRRELAGPSHGVPNYYEDRKTALAELEVELKNLADQEKPLLDALGQQYEQYAAFQKEEKARQEAAEAKKIEDGRILARLEAQQELQRQEDARLSELERLEKEATRKREHDATEAEKQRDHELQMALIQRDTAIAQAEAAKRAAEANAKAQEQAIRSLDALINGIKGDGAGKN